MYILFICLKKIFVGWMFIDLEVGCYMLIVNVFFVIKGLMVKLNFCICVSLDENVINIKSFSFVWINIMVIWFYIFVFVVMLVLKMFILIIIFIVMWLLM